MFKILISCIAFLFLQTLQKDMSHNLEEAKLLFKAGNELIQGRERALGSQEIKEEMDELRKRLDNVNAAANDRQKKLESTWSAVKHFDEGASSLVVVLHQKLNEVRMLMKPRVDQEERDFKVKVRK